MFRFYCQSKHILNSWPATNPSIVVWQSSLKTNLILFNRDTYYRFRHQWPEDAGEEMEVWPDLALGWPERLPGLWYTHAVRETFLEAVALADELFLACEDALQASDLPKLALGFLLTVPAIPAISRSPSGRPRRARRGRTPRVHLLDSPDPLPLPPPNPLDAKAFDNLIRVDLGLPPLP